MISLFFLGVLLFIVLWNFCFGRLWYRRMEVSLDFVQDYVYVGEQAQMTERIENRKRMMLPVLEVAFHIRKELVFSDFENTNVSDFTYKRDIFAMLGNQRIIRTLTLDCTKRGCYRIDRSQVTTFSLLHRRRYSMEFPADTELYVYAGRTEVSDIMVVCERMMGNVQCARLLCEDPFAHASIREYTITDPMKTINWKASAKTGNLMVNTFESTLMEKVMIYADLEDTGILKYEDLTEETISIAASLARRMIRRGMEVGIRVNAVPETRENVYLKPAGGRLQLTEIERMLARRRTGEKTTAFASILTEPAEDAVMILISKNVSESQEAIAKFIGKERQGIWVVPVLRGEERQVRTVDNVRIIRREVERS